MMNQYDLNNEEKAFLFQEAQELAPLVKDLGSLSVVVEKTKESDHFCVTFVIAPESMGLRIQATNNNLFDATIEAKTVAQRQLNALINALPVHANPSSAAVSSQLLH